MTANFFSALCLDPDDDEDVPNMPTASTPTKKHASKRKGRKGTSGKDVVMELVTGLATLSSDITNEDFSLNKEGLKMQAQEKKCTSTLENKGKLASTDMEHEKTVGSLVDVTKTAASGTETNTKQSTVYLKWPLVWIDLEMTGLDLEKDRILEIACIITDGKLQKMIEGPDLIINQAEELLASMGDWCQTHHTANGLVEGVRKSKVTEQEAEQEVVDFVRRHTGQVQPLLAGNSVYVDFMFLRKYMPNLASLFPHVVVDVSSIKALCLRWFPKDAERAPVKKKQHRALEDIKESIAELRYMQKTIFKESKR